jgi:FkbH-like protein
VYGGRSLREIRQITKYLREYPEATTPVKIAVLSTYTTELLQDHWTLQGLLHGLEFELYAADYGQVVQELHDQSGLARFRPDFTYILMQRQDIVPSLAGPLHSLSAAERDDLVGMFCAGLRELLAAARSVVSGTIVISFLPAMGVAGLGAFDVMSGESEAALWAKVKRESSRLLRQEFASVHLDDGDEIAASLGAAGWFDARLWFSSRFPFSVAGANLFVHRLTRYPVLTNTPKLKCIVLDCDNTLWGGIIGEDGVSGIAMGSEYPGACYVSFQRRLLDFLYRGCLLSICSKNNPEDVLDVLREHPSMLVREESVAALRIGWEPKPEMLRAMADELQLGIDSFLFVDDSPHECRLMRSALPEVRVAQVPADPLQVPGCLDHLQELEILSFTEEDRTRSGMYTQNRQRSALAVQCGDLSEYLRSLDMKISISCNDPTQVPRLAQLTQKTNQFNLTTKRYSEDDVLSFVDDPDWLVAHFSLSDVFGESGIVGLLLASGMSSTTGVVHVDTFLISCRVIGRRAEEVFLHETLRLLHRLGKQAVVGRYVPTPKNALVESFWKDQGFTSNEDESWAFELDSLAEEHPAASYFNIALSEPSF